jgi:hypothetical protein
MIAPKNECANCMVSNLVEISIYPFLALHAAPKSIRIVDIM